MILAGFSILSIFGLFATTNAYESVEDAARIARQLVDLSTTSIGTMATIFPSNEPLSAHPFSLQEYYASCMHNGSLTLIFLPISRHSRNILGSPEHQASISITSERPTASKPRVALMGNVTVLHDFDDEEMKTCYLEKHPDARFWLPGDKKGAHTSYWARFDPQTVYFVGGFGDTHYIGYIPLHLYQDAAPMHSINTVRKTFAVAGRVIVDQS